MQVEEFLLHARSFPPGKYPDNGHNADYEVRHAFVQFTLATMITN